MIQTTIQVIIDKINVFIVNSSKNKKGEEFVQLCREGNLEAIKILIDSNKVNYFYNYPIQVASSKGHLELVKLLLDNGANVKAHNNLAIKFASQNGHLEVVKLLLDKGAVIPEEHLNNIKPNIKDYLSSINNNKTIVKSQANEQMDKYIYDNNHFIEIDHANRHVETVNLKIFATNDTKVILEQSNIILGEVKENGYLDLGQEQGDNIQTDNNKKDINNSYDDDSDNDNNEEVTLEDCNQILKETSEHGYLDLVQLAIEHGANIQTDNNYSIKIANSNDHLEVVKLLSDQGAILNEGYTNNLYEDDEFCLI